MELWFTEEQTSAVSLGLRVRRTLHEETTPFQHLAVLETEGCGRALVLDGAIQLTESDEFVYHEMIVHVPLGAHPAPRRVAVIGGGDGGAVREVLKHPTIERVVLVEIDGSVVQAARRFLPAVSAALDDPRVEVRIEDGVQHVAERASEYDVIVVDSTDPVGPATGLFGERFYQHVARALRPGGLAVAQTESPFLNADLIRNARERFLACFPVVRLYLAAVPTYPSGLWSFTVGSLGPDPASPAPGRTSGAGPIAPLRYYTPAVHRAAFALPGFVEAEVLSAASTSGGGAV